MVGERPRSSARGRLSKCSLEVIFILRPGLKAALVENDDLKFHRTFGHTGPPRLIVMSQALNPNGDQLWPGPHLPRGNVAKPISLFSTGKTQACRDGTPGDVQHEEHSE